MDRENEFENPGGNYPDQGGSPEPSHVASGVGVPDAQPSQGGSAPTETTGGKSPEHPSAPTDPPEDGGPIMDQHPASDVDKIAGIVAQTRSDVGTEPVERIAEVLRQRFSDSGLEVSDDEVADLAQQVATGDSTRS